MKKAQYVIVLMLGIAVWQVGRAQTYSLMHRSSIEISIGIWNESSAGNQIATNGMVSNAKTNGLAGELSYAYWPQENLALTMSAGIISAEATAGSSGTGILGPTQRTSTVIPILCGVKYYFLEPVPSSFARLYLSGAIGPTLGFEAKNSLFIQEAHSESALGGRVGGGVDVLWGQSFKVGLNAGYFLMTNFKESVGARTNYNGPAVTFNVGLIFGSSE
ncbi:MAG: hypothetical protein HY276_08945 [Ignavibacteriales bacterium]|nr:hypothetical protein [Ignavibacteriales bacterium]